MNLKQVISLVSIFLVLLIAGCASTPEIVETLPVEISTEEAVSPPEPTLIVESSLENYLTLSQLAAAVRAGELDVGDGYGMGVDQRFHTIHAKTIGMACTQCHVREAQEEVARAPEGSPGVADRRACLGCHLNGPAFALYDPKE